MQIVEFDSVDSTNLEVRRLWPRLGGGGAVAVRASVQSAGRGRGGHFWRSPVGGLWFSLGRPLAPGAPPPGGLSLVAGLALSEAVRECCGLDCLLKWPNDLIAAGRKLAGILCEAFPGGNFPLAVIGVGVNGNYPAAELGEDLAMPATTLLEEMGRECDLGRLFRGSLEQLEKHLGRLEREGFAPFQGLVEERLVWRKEPVSFAPAGGDAVQGILAGIDDTGALLLETGEGRRRLVAGDLVRLRRG